MSHSEQPRSQKIEKKVQALLSDVTEEKRIGWHVIAFLDLLGQQAKLRELNALPNTVDAREIADFERRIEEIYKPIVALRKIFKAGIEASIDLNGSNANWTPQDQEFRRQLRATPTYQRPFADSLIVDIPLLDSIGKFPSRAIYFTLVSTAITFFSCLAFGCIFRGGIDMGLAMEIGNDELYGPAIARAYALESKVANYPRVVVGEGLTRYLREVATHPEPTKEGEMNRRLALRALSLLGVDDDGKIFLDYLGEHIRSVWTAPEQILFVQKAYDFVMQEFNKHREGDNAKLGRRYSLLRKYVESRLPSWGIALYS